VHLAQNLNSPEWLSTLQQSARAHFLIRADPCQEILFENAMSASERTSFCCALIEMYLQGCNHTIQNEIHAEADGM
jgi:hypothetical protein